MNTPMTSVTGTDGSTKRFVARARDFAVSEQGRTLLAGAVLLLNCILLIVFLFTSYKGYFHSDSAVRNLLAQEMYDSGSFFPSGWNYVNKDLMVVFAQLGVLPLLAFFDNSYTLFAVVGVVTCALILASAWWFTGLLGGQKWQRLLALAVLAGGVSANMAEGVFGQAAYGFMLMLTCLTAVLGWNTISTEAVKRVVWGGLLLVLATLFTWSNPQRAMATYLLPLYSGMLFYLWGEDWKPRLRALLPAIIVTMAGFLAGAALSVWTLKHVQNYIGAGSALWLGFDGMARNAVHTLHGLLALLGGVPVKGTSLVTPMGAYQAVRLVGALVLLVLIGRRIVQLCSSGSDRSRFVGGVTAGAAACFLFLHMTTTIPDMNDPVSVSRYLVPSLCLGLMVLFASPLTPNSRLGNTLTLGLALLLAGNTVVRFNPESLLSDAWAAPGRTELAKELEASGASYGYASYWDAGSYTILTDSKVKLRAVQIIGGELQPMRHLSSNDWYEPEAWKGETLLLLSDAEVATVNWGLLTRYAGQPIREKQIGNRRLFVFKENLARTLPGWSLKLREPLRLEATPDSPKTVGQWKHDSNTVQTKLGEGGYLHYGPYSTLGPGTYEARFDVQGAADVPSRIVGEVDVVAFGGTVMLGREDVLGNGAGPYTVRFRLPNIARNLEFRVKANGNGEMTYTSVTLSPQP